MNKSELGFEQLQSVSQPSGEQQLQSVAEEHAIALVYNGISHAVLMASPVHLEDLAVGFSLSEGIINQQGEFYGCDIKRGELGIELKIEISSAAMSRLKSRRRSLLGPSGCGLCGIESLKDLQRNLAQVKTRSVPSNTVIKQAIYNLDKQQPLRQETGASHCVAACENDGTILTLREDVGRHNALDKLIGARSPYFTDNGEQAANFYIASSRASYEMIVKAISCGISTLVCLSAPTSLAVKTAREHHLNLIAFARPDKYRLYSGFNNE